MNILFISGYGQSELKHYTKILPRVGDRVDLFYYPYPIVTQVLLHPTIDTIKKIGEISVPLDAIVTVE